MMRITIPPIPRPPPTPTPPKPRRSSMLPLPSWLSNLMASPSECDRPPATPQSCMGAAQPIASRRDTLAQGAVVVVARGVHARQAQLHGTVAEGERHAPDLQECGARRHAEELRHLARCLHRTQPLVGAQHVDPIAALVE